MSRLKLKTVSRQSQPQYVRPSAYVCLSNTRIRMIDGYPEVSIHVYERMMLKDRLWKVLSHAQQLLQSGVLPLTLKANESP